MILIKDPEGLPRACTGAREPDYVQIYTQVTASCAHLCGKGVFPEPALCPP